MRKLFKLCVVIAFLLACGGSTFFTWFLFQMNKLSAESFEIGKKALEVAQTRAKKTPDPKIGLQMTYESFEKLKSEQYNQRWLAKWDRKGQKIARKLSRQGKILTKMSDQGVKEANARRKDLKKSQELSRELLAIQRKSEALAKEMYELSKKLLPFSEALPRLIP